MVIQWKNCGKKQYELDVFRYAKVYTHNLSSEGSWLLGEKIIGCYNLVSNHKILYDLHICYTFVY